jgi:hypothetical protein
MSWGNSPVNVNNRSFASMTPPSPNSVDSKQSYTNSNNGTNIAFEQYMFPAETYYEYARTNVNLLLYYASKFNNTEKILKLRFTNPNLMKYDHEYNRNMNPLLYAIVNDNIIIFKLLLSSENIDVNFFIDDNMNPLIHELLQFNNLKYLKLLLSHPNLDLTIQNDKGYTAIIKSIQYFDNNPREYLKIIKQMIRMNENITIFNGMNILRLAFKLSVTSERNELLMLLYEYQKLPEGREKDYIERLKQFKDARHFVTHVSKKPQLSRQAKREILSYLTTKPKTRFKNMTYNNNASLRVAARSYPFNNVLPYNILKPYLSKTKKQLLENKETKRRLAGSRRVHNYKKK